MAAAVAEKGYGPVAVADIVQRANVSRRTFYEHFPDKQACFLATFDTGVEFVISRMLEAAATVPADDWAARLRVSIGTYLAVLAEEPEFAWALEIESLAAGPEAVAQRAAAVATIAAGYRQLYALARHEDKSLPTLPDEMFLAFTGGVDELIRETMRNKGAAALPGIVEVAVRFMETMFGPAVARRS